MNLWQGIKREAVLDIYRFAVRHLETEEGLSPGQADKQIRHLRWLLRQSMSLGGPANLVELSEQPDLCARILREPGGASHDQVSRCHQALADFLRLTFDADLAGQRLEAIEVQLIARRIKGWYQAERVAGGRRTREESRRLMFGTDLLALTEAAGEEKSGERALRDRCLVALLCWSGLRTGEIVSLLWEQMLWEDPRPDDPFTAWVRCSRDGRQLTVPVHRRAAEPLALLYAMTKRIMNRQPEGRVFRTLRGPYAPLGYRSLREILDEALAKRELRATRGDLLAAFADYLMAAHGCTVPDLATILGYKQAESVQGLLRSHRAWRLNRKADQSGELFGNAVGENDTCRQPSIAPDGMAQPPLFE
jgi:integrase